MAEPLRIPAFTAYAEPGEKTVWLGKLLRAGALTLSAGLQTSQAARLRLTAQPVGEKRGQRFDVDVSAPGEVRFGTLRAAPGYWRFSLETLAGSAPTLTELVLSGEASEGAHFNKKERRNAASVHLRWPTEKDAPITAFYNEITAREEPIYTYYMACGFARGYFGIQVNSPTERRVIFSVWDSGSEAIDRNKVAQEDRVQLLEKGEGVVADSFGNEGTGGHSHLVYPWKKNQTYRLCVTVKPDGTHTEYAGWFYFPERRAWGLIARFRAPRDGKYLGSLYSFSENFGGDNGQLLRRVELRNAWIQLAGGTWKPLLKTSFSCDATGRARDRIDFAAGVAPSGRFYLQHGGFTDNGVAYGDTFSVSGAGKPPRDLPQPPQ